MLQYYVFCFAAQIITRLATEGSFIWLPCPLYILYHFVFLSSRLILHIPCPRLAAAAKSLQLCLTLCDPIDGSPPGSSIPGILQARILEWVAICFSKACRLKINHFSKKPCSPALGNGIGNHQ